MKWSSQVTQLSFWPPHNTTEGELCIQHEHKIMHLSCRSRMITATLIFTVYHARQSLNRY